MLYTMEKNSKGGNTFDAIMRNLKDGIYEPVYVLMGNESYYIDQIADYIAANALPEAERDFNQNVVFGADTSDAAVMDMARRFPMMAERQVVIVKEAQNIKKYDAFEKYLRNPMPSTVLVWCHKNGTIDRRKKFMSMAEKVGVVFESKKLRDYELPGFIESYIRDKGATIDNKASQMIADSVGPDLFRLVSELDKLFIGMKDGDKRIMPEMVEEKIGISKEFNSFELRTAIANKNIEKANLIIKYFDDNPKSGQGYVLIPTLFRFFQDLMIVYYSPRNNNDKDIADALGLKNTWAAKDYVSGKRNYSARKTMDIISKIREIDAKSKGLDNTNTSIGELMKELIFFILH